MKELKIGECIHNKSGICSCGKYQNYPCQYKNNIDCCYCSHAITEDIKKQWETKGYYIIPCSQLKYNPFKLR